MKHDPGYNKASKNKKVGIVGETSICVIDTAKAIPFMANNLISEIAILTLY